ncbi:CLUMA_CG001704, isoform B [Clunio marinus]|uniref:CLUMA_CG001704, isoform B n=1 Tax=Clunio marinus TaxID=568069 RepID=A0A1J1HN74_9DIPT|nr:CLUMA_CG001704, isoform B [Clunio marinus]
MDVDSIIKELDKILEISKQEEIESGQSKDQNFSNKDDQHSQQQTSWNYGNLNTPEDQTKDLNTTMDQTNLKLKLQEVVGGNSRNQRDLNTEHDLIKFENSSDENMKNEFTRSILTIDRVSTFHDENDEIIDFKISAGVQENLNDEENIHYDSISELNNEDLESKCTCFQSESLSVSCSSQKIENTSENIKTIVNSNTNFQHVDEVEWNENSMQSSSPLDVSEEPQRVDITEENMTKALKNAVVDVPKDEYPRNILKVDNKWTIHDDNDDIIESQSSEDDTEKATLDISGHQFKIVKGKLGFIQQADEVSSSKFKNVSPRSSNLLDPIEEISEENDASDIEKSNLRRYLPSDDLTTLSQDDVEKKSKLVSNHDLGFMCNLKANGIEELPTTTLTNRRASKKTKRNEQNFQFLSTRYAKDFDDDGYSNKLEIPTQNLQNVSSSVWMDENVSFDDHNDIQIGYNRAPLGMATYSTDEQSFNTAVTTLDMPNPINTSKQATHSRDNEMNGKSGRFHKCKGFFKRVSQVFRKEKI